MRIPPLSDPTDILWEGPLAAPEGAKGLTSDIHGNDNLIGTIAAPAVWADGQLLGKGWQPPLGGARFHVARLAFSLRAQGRVTVTAADFTLRLVAQPGLNDGPVVFSAFPLQTTVEEAREVTVGLSPKLTLGEVGAEVGNVSATFDRTQVIPVVTAYDAGTAAVLWRYTAHRRYPLEGTRVMLAVAQLPAGLPWVSASLELTADAETRYGPIRVALPETAWPKVRFDIGR